MLFNKKDFKVFKKMKKLLILFLFCLPHLVTMAAAEECAIDQPVCFGIAWNTVTLDNLKGININARDVKNKTPLHWAARNNNNPKIISILINAGADINAKDRDDWTPLHSASYNNDNPKILSALINSGDIENIEININAETKFGSTPLHLAAEHNKNPKILSTLLNAGARIDARNKIDNTPLHMAALYSKNPKILSTLLNAKADVTIKNRDGQTAYDLIQQNKKLKDTPIYQKLQDLSFD